MRVQVGVMLLTSVMHQRLSDVRAMPVNELMYWARAAKAMRSL